MTSEAREGGVALADWQPIATVTDRFDGFEDEVILVWSECDGPHTVWLMSEPAYALLDGRYTHWALSPPPPRQEPQRAEAGESVLRPDLKAPAKSTHHRDRCEDFTMSQHGELSTGAEASERGRDA